VARLDRELDQADKSADDLEDAFRDVERAADRAADETGRIDKEAKEAGGSVGGLSKGLKGLAVAAAVAIGIREIGQFLAAAVTAAVDLSESINAVEVVFGDASETILAFGADTTDAVFLANSEFNQLASVTGTLLQGFGLEVQQVADITIVLTERAADLASVFNTEVSVALEAINAALRGETEQIRRFTGSFSIDEVKAFGRELFGVTGELTTQQQALAAVEFLLVKTDQVQGDAANTAGELANRQRALTEQWINAQASVGDALIPAVEGLVDSLIGMIPVIESAAKALASLINISLGSRPRELQDEFATLTRLVAEGATEAEAYEQIYGFDLVDAFQSAAAMGQDLVTETLALEAAAMAASLAADVESDAFKESALAGAAFAKAQQGLEDSLEATTEELQAQRQAVIALAREQVAAADPIINLIRRREDLETAQAELAEIEAAGTERADELQGAQLRLIEATGALEVAEVTVKTAIDETTEGFINQAIAAGLAEEAIDRLLDVTDRLRNIPITPLSEFELSGGRRRGGGGGDGGGQAPQIELNFNNLIDPDIPGNAAQAANMIGAIVGATSSFVGRS